MKVLYLLLYIFTYYRRDRTAWVAEASKTLFEASPPLLGTNVVHATVRDRASEVDDAIRFPCSRMQESLRNLVSSNSIYGRQN